MWSSTQRGRPLAAAFALVLACGPLACQDDPVAPDAGGEPAAAPEMRLVELTGTVEWRPGAQPDWRPATRGQGLSFGDGLRTAAKALAVIEFADGSRLRLAGGTSLTLTGLEDEFELLVAEGQLEVAATAGRGRGFKLMFGEAGDMIVVREGQAKVAMREDGVHIEMIMGQATIHQGDQTQALQAGKSFVLSIGRGQIVDRESVETVLKDRRRASRIKVPDAQRFKRPTKRQVALRPGTEVRTPRGAGVELTDPAGGRVVLGPRSRATFEGTFKGRDGREGTLRLASGVAKVKLRRQGGAGATQAVVTPHAAVETDAAGLTADVTVTARPKQTQVVVNAGRAQVSAGDRKVALEAGHTVTIGPQGIQSEPAPLPVPRLRAREGKRTRIFFDRRLGKVTLGWKAIDDEQVTLEVSAKADFSELDLREPVRGDSFLVDLPRRGRLHWRVSREGAGPGPASSISVARDPYAKRRAGAATNVVPDTGIKTTILFQGKVPALTFKWDALPQAEAYRVRVYSADDMEKAVLNQKATRNRLVLAAGKLSEGTYFWYQAALDAAGKEIKASQMNKLVLEFDNAASLLRIDSPRPGQRPKAGKIQVAGLAPAGAKVSINGQPISVPPDGRFRQTDKARRGELLVFRLQRRGAGDVLYTRHLGR